MFIVDEKRGLLLVRQFLHFSNFKTKFSFRRFVRTSETRLGDLLDFGQLFKAFGNN